MPFLLRASQIRALASMSSPSNRLFSVTNALSVPASRNSFQRTYVSDRDSSTSSLGLFKLNPNRMTMQLTLCDLEPYTPEDRFSKIMRVNVQFSENKFNIKFYGENAGLDRYLLLDHIKAARIPYELVRGDIVVSNKCNAQLSEFLFELSSHTCFAAVNAQFINKFSTIIEDSNPRCAY